jgi:hypothetical protein
MSAGWVVAFAGRGVERGESVPGAGPVDVPALVDQPLDDCGLAAVAGVPQRLGDVVG